MPGFLGYLSMNKAILTHPIELGELVAPNQTGYQDADLTVSTDGLYGQVYRHAVNKFMNDRVFEQNDQYVLLLDGVILNKAALFDRFGDQADTQMRTLLPQLIASGETTFFNQFRGSFAGAHLNRATGELTVYTNQVGDKPVYYYEHQVTQTLYFAMDLMSLVTLMRQHGIDTELNQDAAYSLLTHGHVLCNETLVAGIRRLTPGHYLTFSKAGLRKQAYFTFSNQPVEIDEATAIAQLDHHFRRAVQLAFEKDREYGYRHLVALSGGLDARMTTWVAHELGYTEMLNYTFSQSDYLDETIPKQIARDLRHEWLFKALDNGLYLYQYFDQVITIGSGISRSASLTHTFSLLSTLNWEQYGLVHTGQLVDVIIGTYYSKGQLTDWHPGAGADSTRLIDRVHYAVANAVNLEDEELFKLYNRGLTGINGGLVPMQQFTETISPFLDVDLMAFCLSLPLRYRRGHHLYIKWINQCYPAAANYVYEKVNGKINRKIVTVSGVPIPWTSVPQAALKWVRKKLGLKLRTRQHMNPTDYWYAVNPELRHFYTQQFEQQITSIENPQLQADCQVLFEQGSVNEKDQVITLLGFATQLKGIS